MSLKPAWVDDPAEASGARGPFGIGGAFQDLSVENCVKVVGGVAHSCLGTSSILLANANTASSRRFPASDYGTIEKAKEAALKHTQHVAAHTSYYFDDPMAKEIREEGEEEEEEEEEDGEGGWGSTHGRPRRARSAPCGAGRQRHQPE